MPIYTSNLTITGNASTASIYTNKLGMNSYSNMSIDSDVHIAGDIYSTGRLDVGTTIHATLQMTSNNPFSGENELTATSNMLTLDWTHTNMSNMNTVPMVITPQQIYNQSTGVITVPASGMYSIHLQGSFSNTTAATNGVYFRFPQSPTPNARIAGQISSGQLVGTSLMRFLNAGEQLTPTFYSSDSNATLMGNGETYLTWMVAATFTH